MNGRIYLFITLIKMCFTVSCNFGFFFGNFSGAPGPPGKRGKRGKKGDPGDGGSAVSVCCVHDS